MAFFDVDEAIQCTQDIPLAGPDDEPLYLAFKTSNPMFIAGVYLRDDGYVLDIKPSPNADPSAYYDLPKAEVEKLQSEVLLPTPTFRLHHSCLGSDYLWGFSLWVVLAVAVNWELLSTRHLKNAVQPSGLQ